MKKIIGIVIILIALMAAGLAAQEVMAPLSAHSVSFQRKNDILISIRQRDCRYIFTFLST